MQSPTTINSISVHFSLLSPIQYSCFSFWDVFTIYGHSSNEASPSILIFPKLLHLSFYHLLPSCLPCDNFPKWLFSSWHRSSSCPSFLYFRYFRDSLFDYSLNVSVLFYFTVSHFINFSLNSLLSLFSLLCTEQPGRLTNTLALYSGCSRFKSRPEDQLRWSDYSWLLSVPPDMPEVDHDSFLPYHPLRFSNATIRCCTYSLLYWKSR